MGVRILCHGDTDGICSAAIARAIFPSAEIRFTRPVSLLRDLTETEPRFTVVILDIAINETQREQILSKMDELSKFGEVIYVDHHPLPYRMLKRDIPATTVAHEIGPSAAELTFRLFRNGLRPDHELLAIWGAIADYCEQTSFVQNGLGKYDRRTVYMEAGLLSQAIGEAGGDYEFKRTVVEALSRLTPPTRIPDLVRRAIEATEQEWELYFYVRSNVERMGPLAVVRQLPRGSLGKAAMFAVGLTGAEVGLCARRSDGEIDISLRRRHDSLVDLNEVLRRIVYRLGGSGGGHSSAAGANIPAGVFGEFLETLASEISPVIRG